MRSATYLETEGVVLRQSASHVLASHASEARLIRDTPSGKPSDVLVWVYHPGARGEYSGTWGCLASPLLP